jgi:hypothetical protein
MKELINAATAKGYSPTWLTWEDKYADCELALLQSWLRERGIFVWISVISHGHMSAYSDWNIIEPRTKTRKYGIETFTQYYSSYNEALREGCTEGLKMIKE